VGFFSFLSSNRNERDEVIKELLESQQKLVTEVTQLRSSLENPSTPLSAFDTEEKTTANIEVNEMKALSIGAVFSCVLVISETTGLMDLEVYRKKGKFKEYDPNHPNNRLFRDPSPHFNSFQWKQVMAAHIKLWGNAYTEVKRNRFAEPIEFIIHQPYNVTPKLTERGRLFYECLTEEGTLKIVTAENMLHFKNISVNGLLGLSTVAIQRESIANSIAKQQHEGAFYANGAKASGIIMTPGTLGLKERNNLQTSFEKEHSGARNRFKTIVLEEGVKYQQLTIPQNDAQFLESKNFDRSEIAGWFRVPPYKIGYMDNANYSNVEAQERSFARDAIVPLSTNFQQELDRKLFFEEERGVFSTQFNLDDITKGDMKTRYEAYGQGIQWGFIKPKWVTEAEGWPTDGSPELDQFFMNSTMRPVKQIIMEQPSEQPNEEAA
jgi:HK97 family phage portal protein